MISCMFAVIWPSKELKHRQLWYWASLRDIAGLATTNWPLIINHTLTMFVCLLCIMKFTFVNVMQLVGFRGCISTCHSGEHLHWMSIHAFLTVRKFGSKTISISTFLARQGPSWQLDVLVHSVECENLSTIIWYWWHEKTQMIDIS